MRNVLTAIGLAACLAVVTGAAAGGDVTVFAAASLKEALDDQSKRFEADTGNKVVVSYAASNTLAKQIEAGAPANLFISADLDWMDYLEKKGRLISGSRANLLRNTLVLVAPAASASTLKIASGFDLAKALDAGKLAMADPDAVPAGKYGKAALEYLGVWTGVEKQVVRAENVRAALALVARGEASFGIVYRTDALAEKDVRIVDTFPASSHPAIVYPAARIVDHDTPAGRALLDYLGSAAARGAWQKYGFAPY